MRGTVEFGGKLALLGDLTAELGPIAAFLGRPVAEGTARFSGSVAGSWKDPEASGDLALKSPVVQGRRWPDARGKVAWSGRRLSWSEVGGGRRRAAHALGVGRPLRAASALPAVYLTSESHHSFVKIARMTGLGTNALHEVAVTERFIMDEKSLEERIVADLEAGWLPLLVVGTAGTTGAGLIDPLSQVAHLADRFGIWFHVDGGWGGSAALSPLLKPALSGIERADSITWDAHKWLSVPMGAGMFFCRHPEAVKRAFAISTSYMPEGAGDDTVDPYATTAQWSRRMIGLKVFMTLRGRRR